MSHRSYCFLVLMAVNWAPLVGVTWATPVIKEIVDQPKNIYVGNGDITVVSLKEMGLNRVIESSTYNQAANRWSDPLLLSSIDSDVNDYKVVFDPLGDVMVVWQSNNGDYEKIQTCTYSKATNSWQPVTDLSLFTEEGSIAHAAMDDKGNALVGWKRSFKNYEVLTTIDYKKRGNHWSKPVIRVLPKDEIHVPQRYYDSVNKVMVTRDKINGKAFLVYSEDE